jgi:hypothetical protein
VLNKRTEIEASSIKCAQTRASYHDYTCRLSASPPLSLFALSPMREEIGLIFPFVAKNLDFLPLLSAHSRSLSRKQQFSSIYFFNTFL